MAFDSNTQTAIDEAQPRKSSVRFLGLLAMHVYIA